MLNKLSFRTLDHLHGKQFFKEGMCEKMYDRVAFVFTNEIGYHNTGNTANARCSVNCIRAEMTLPGRECNNRHEGI
jgi:hypothetical protein